MRECYGVDGLPLGGLICSLQEGAMSNDETRDYGAADTASASEPPAVPMVPGAADVDFAPESYPPVPGAIDFGVVPPEKSSD